MKPSFIVVHFACAAALAVMCVPSARAEEGENMREAFAIMQKECLRCHTEEKSKGGLRMTSREELLKGGDTGPALVPKKASESLMVEMLFPDADPHMPPKSQLDPKQIRVLEQWIDAGASWDQSKWYEMRTARRHKKVAIAAVPDGFRPVLAVSLSPDGGKLAVGKGSKVEVFSIDEEGNTGLLQSLDGHSDLVQSLAWSEDGGLLASGGFRKVIIRESDQFSVSKEINEGIAGRVTALTFVPSGRLVAADSMPSGEALLHWFDLANDASDTIEAAHDDTIFDIEVSPDGKLLASASADKFVHLRDAETGKLKGTLEGHTGYALAVAFGPESKRIATAGDDAAIKVWRIATRKQISTFGGDVKSTGPVTGLAWMVHPENKEKKKAEKDPEKAKLINTDLIIATTEKGKITKYSELVEHEGAQRSTGARGRDMAAAGRILCGITLDRSSELCFSGTTDGGILKWDKSGKLSEVESVQKDTAQPEPPNKP